MAHVLQKANSLLPDASKAPDCVDQSRKVASEEFKCTIGSRRHRHHHHQALAVLSLLLSSSFFVCLSACLPACLPARFRTQARRTKALRDDVAWMACPSKTRNKKKKKKRCGSPGRDESLCALQIIIATTSTLISRSRKEDTQGGWPDPATFTAQSCLLAERRERIKKSQQRWR